jgi:hypothetical protein
MSRQAMTTRDALTAADLEALRELAAGRVVSNTRTRRLAKLGWVHIQRSTRVYDGATGEPRRVLVGVHVTSAGRAALASIGSG